MSAKVACRVSLLLTLFCASAVLSLGAEDTRPAQSTKSLLSDPSFELGSDKWRLGLGGKTVARFSVDSGDAADGEKSGRVSLGAVESWGAQLAQVAPALESGKICTYAVLAKSLKGPVSLTLEIQRHGGRWDRVTKSAPLIVGPDAWKEIYITFKVQQPYPEGWSVMVGCQQPNVEFRVDKFRLYEGEYVPADQAARGPATVASTLPEVAKPATPPALPRPATAASKKPNSTSPRPALDPAAKLFDTGSASVAPLSAEALEKKAGWQNVPEDTTEHAFVGDAVVVNNRLTVVFRRGGPGAEVYGRGPEGFALRAVLAPAADAQQVKLAAVAIADNSPGSVAVDAVFQPSAGATLTLRYDVPAGQPYVKTEVRAGAKALAVEAPSRFVVLPDFFADDIVVDATEIPVASAELPSENFLVHLLPDRNAMVMTVAESREQDARVALSGQGAERMIGRSEIFYGKSGKAWVAVLETPGIWHQRDVGSQETGDVIPLDWTAPFPCMWRVDWQTSDKLASSWEMIMATSSGSFEKPAMWGEGGGRVSRNRTCWATVLGSYLYPCWLDQSGQGFLQPMATPVRFVGPAVIYPINRLKTTPLDQFTVVDVVKNTLGVGPCQYILDVEGQGASRKGIATCATRDELQAIYKANRQKQKRTDIERLLGEVVVFVKHIRGRIEEYSAFDHDMLTYIGEQKKTHPQAAAFLDDMEKIAKELRDSIAVRQENIKTPQYVVDLTEEFRKNLLDAEGPDALKECVRITEAIVQVGGNQDELVGECRMHVKVLRQRAGMAMATHPAAAEVAKEIRDRTQKILRNALSYEHPRH